MLVKEKLLKIPQPLWERFAEEYFEQSEHANHTQALMHLLRIGLDEELKRLDRQKGKKR